MSDKRALRRHHRAERARRDPAALAAASAAITARLLALPELLAARRVFAYVDTPGEVQTRALISAILASGRSVAVPRIEESGAMVAVRLPSLDALVAGRFGIPTAVGPALTDDPEFTVVPGLAFDARGGRLGLGAGYYDAWLGAHRTFACAVCLEDQVIPEVPMTDRDVPVHAVATPTRLIRCR